MTPVDVALPGDITAHWQALAFEIERDEMKLRLIMELPPGQVITVVFGRFRVNAPGCEIEARCVIRGLCRKGDPLVEHFGQLGLFRVKIVDWIDGEVRPMMADDLRWPPEPEAEAE